MIREKRLSQEYSLFLKAMRKISKLAADAVERRLSSSDFEAFMREMRRIDFNIYKEILEVEKEVLTTDDYDKAFIKKRVAKLLDYMLNHFSPDAGYVPEGVRHPVRIYLKAERHEHLTLEREKEAMKLVNDYDGKLVHVFDVDDRVIYAHLTDDAIKAMRKNPNVERVIKESPQVEIMMAQQVTWCHDMMNTHIPHAKKIKGRGVKICIVDTGVDYTHEDLKDRWKGGWNFVENNNNPMDRHGHGCTHPDTFTYTSAGINRIEDLWNVYGNIGYEADVTDKKLFTFSIDKNKGSIEKSQIEKIFKIPVKEDIVEVISSTGLHLKLTPWHPTFIFDGKTIVEKRADEIRHNDFILVPNIPLRLEYDYQNIDGRQITENIAWAIGAFLGDGSFRRLKRKNKEGIETGSIELSSIELSSTDNKIGKKFHDILQEFATSTGTYKDKRNDIHRYIVYGKTISHFFETITGLNGMKKTYNISIPPVILCSPDSVIRAFLAGYLDTDGHISKSRNKILFSTVSKIMADQLGFLLNTLGIRSCVTICKPTGKAKVNCYQIVVTGINEVKKLSSLKDYMASDNKKQRLEAIISKQESIYVKNTAMPLSLEAIGSLRALAKAVKVSTKHIKVAKGKRTAYGIARYKLEKFISLLGHFYYSNVLRHFQFIRIKEVKRSFYEGFFYDFKIKKYQNYIAGNFGATFIHNTHCAGIACATDNDRGILGVAPEADLYGVKVLRDDGSGTWSAVTAGVEWATKNGMDVISLSLGGGYADPLLKEACDAAYAAGIYVVAAAGNSGTEMMFYPAAFESVVAVAALTSEYTRASFSTYGSQIEIAAPGQFVLSCLPDNEYDAWSGTSMACPHVAGLAALVKSWYPYYRGNDIRKIINENAFDL